MQTRFDVIVIGGGQAGLAMGYHLARRGLDFLILDAAVRSGESWRQRWDSLTLFTPSRYSSLPGMPFPADPDHYPRKNEVAQYLESYAGKFGLPIRYGTRVTRLRYLSEWRGFVVEAGDACFEADQVIVATGAFQTPHIPGLAHALSTDVMQVHSSEYRSPGQLPAGDVLVVGAGNSGVQIASELARTRRTWLSASELLPTLPEQFMKRSVFWWLDSLGMMSVPAESRIGRRAQQREFLIGKSARQIAQSEGVKLVGRASGAEGDVVFTSDGAAIEAAAVIWATGFRQDFSWIDAPVLDASGKPQQRRGVTAVRGLYFLGLPWQHTRGSALIGWVGRDAEYLAAMAAR